MSSRLGIISIYILLSSFQLAHGKGLLNKEIDSLILVAWDYRVSAPDSGMLYARQALKLAQQESYPKGIGDAYSKLGTLYEAIAEYDSAIAYHQKSFDVRMALGDSLAAWGSYQNIGNSYFRLGKLEESLTYFYGGLQGFDHTVDSLEILPIKAKACNNLGLAYMAMALEKPRLSDSVFHYFNLALDLYRDLFSPLEVSDVFTNLGGLHRQLEQNDSALFYFQQAKDLLEGTGHLSSLSGAHNNLGSAYLDIGQVEKAIPEFELAELLADSSDNAYNLSNAYYNLSIAWEMMDSMFLSLDYLHKHLELETERLSTDKTVSLLRQHNVFQLAQKEKEQEIIEARANEATAQRNVFLISLLAVAILTILITLYLRNRIRLQRINSLRAAEQQRNEHIELINEKEVESLQALMEVQESERARIAKDLHDQLGNSLITAKLNVDAIKLKEGDLPEGVVAPLETTETFIKQALDQVRSISHDMNTGIMAKFGLRRILEDLVKGIDTAGFMKVNLVMDGKSDHVQRDTSILVYRLTQELINNAVKHADARNLSIQVLTNEFEVTLTVEDDGKGFKPFDSDSKNSDGMGLSNMLTVVEDAGGELSVESSPGNGATFIISLPIHNDNDL